MAKKLPQYIPVINDKNLDDSQIMRLFAGLLSLIKYHQSIRNGTIRYFLWR